MKPDWKDAPQWAKYLARDQDGTWWWYQRAPLIGDSVWWSLDDTEMLRVEYLGDTTWKDSLEERPK